MSSAKQRGLEQLLNTESANSKMLLGSSSGKELLLSALQMRNPDFNQLSGVRGGAEGQYFNEQSIAPLNLMGNELDQLPPPLAYDEGITMNMQENLKSPGGHEASRDERIYQFGDFPSLREIETSNTGGGMFTRSNLQYPVDRKRIVELIIADPLHTKFMRLLKECHQAKQAGGDEENQGSSVIPIN
mmetsp:Transcript_18372/g.31406  ORF Transcript_18372/g.31406 Transcript_18372/m.31406 type:complete len:187 (+) Transcript_18372:314-874(+)